MTGLFICSYFKFKICLPRMDALGHPSWVSCSFDIMTPALETVGPWEGRSEPVGPVSL